MLQARDGMFYLDDEPFQILSGAMHYFRTVPEHWEDRLQKLKALGLNTVETYVPWNQHEPKKGQFEFSGLADIEQFIQLAYELDLYVIIRPSPYICAEWEMGGLPSWLLKNPDIVLRSSDPVYLQHVAEYYDVLLPKLRPFLYQHGGPVIAMQIENEYGAYGNDQQYLAFFKDQYAKHGLETFLFTSDGPEFIKQGSLPDVTTTLNFGSKVERAFQQLEELKPGSPKMVAEFWVGWFDYWTGKHHTRNAEDAARVFKELLENNSSVNFYMFHGGTNFGFMNGANHYDIYYPTITSYDYDSLLTESGQVTDKYRAIKRTLRAYMDVPEDYQSKLTAKAYGTVELKESVSLFDTLEHISRRVEHVTPLSMEEIDQSYGYTLYRTKVERQGELSLKIDAIQDRGFVYINGSYVTTVYKNDEEHMITLPFPEENNTLEILVENMGRANYGEHLADRKGIIHNIWLGEQYFFHWEMYAIELECLPTDYGVSGDSRYPKFFRGIFDAPGHHDTFVDAAGFTKGNIFINGFNLGRYWNTAGPQQRLYLPGPLLKEKHNELVILELEGTSVQHVQLEGEHVLSDKM
ncbi:beta-galactosidase [Sediminibacillus dalangtanensis]|uniref:Beta-galactosidase n=1 Tax=Sediminibacillus dalangtanensis TaxID=2729421 RepID=A0ABX7VUW4_9BACI|nr:glycoside hydrolase family 35 protein [Sediminibacillus dalangtanensis]QTN00748.1 beta-galactosidase [Sediminibacillus dalangtanensis]